MTPLLIAWAFILGLIVGSFLNVVIARLPEGKSLSGRSRCQECEMTLRWYDLVPVLSFLLLRARCRQCGARISFQYPLIELATGISFAFLVYHLGLSLELVLLLVAVSLLIVIFVYDLFYSLIPDKFSYPLASVGFLSLFVSGNFLVTPGWGELLIGPGLFTFFYLFWKLSSGRAMGLGDAKLSLGLGWLLGLLGGVTMLVLSFWVGAVVAIILLILSRFELIDTEVGRKTAIPFGPFLILSSVFVYITEWSILLL